METERGIVGGENNRHLILEAWGGVAYLGEWGTIQCDRDGRVWVTN